MSDLPLPSRMSSLETPLLRKNDTGKILAPRTSLLTSVYSSNDNETALNTISEFRRQNAKQREEFNIGENFLDEDDYRSYFSILSKIMKNMRWKHLLKSFVVSLVSVVQIICWIFITIFQPSLLISISAIVNSLASAIAFFFEPKVHYFNQKVVDEIGPEEEELRCELDNIVKENEIAEKRVQELRDDIYRQKCIIQDLGEMKSDIQRRRELLEEENEKILKSIRICDVKSLLIDELFCLLIQKSVRADSEEEEKKNELLEKSTYHKLCSTMDGKKEFQVNEIKKIIFGKPDRLHHTSGINNMNQRRKRSKMKNHPVRFTSFNNDGYSVSASASSTLFSNEF